MGKFLRGKVEVLVIIGFVVNVGVTRTGGLAEEKFPTIIGCCFSTRLRFETLLVDDRVLIE